MEEGKWNTIHTDTLRITRTMNILGLHLVRSTSALPDMGQETYVEALCYLNHCLVMTIVTIVRRGIDTHWLEHDELSV